MPLGNDRNNAAQRKRHAVWAGVIALFLALSTLLTPLEQFTFILQSRLANFKASGDIVYVGAAEDLADPNFPGRRIQLAESLASLHEIGVDRVYLDLPFERPSTPEADNRLNEALQAFNGKAFLVRRVSTGIDGRLVLDNTNPAVSAGIPQVATIRWRNFLDHVWEMPDTVGDSRQSLPSMHVSMARMSSRRGNLLINYGFALDSIPSHRFDELQVSPGTLGSHRSLSGDLVAEFRGKTVVISSMDPANRLRIPGHANVPLAMADIYAAETLKAGYTRYLLGWQVALAFLVVLLLLGRVTSRRWRNVGYAAIVAAIPAGIFIAAKSALATSFAGALVLLLIYGFLRARALWRSGLRLLDEETGLPTFAALEADSAIATTVPAIIVARIHRFEEVKRSLPRELHPEYLLRLIARLRAAKQDATIYIGQGHLIAWTFPEKEPALIREHLEGLRALFSSPLLVGDNQVDVRITFGVDITSSPNVTRRLAAAVDAAERTTETYEPVVIAETTSDEDLIWNISLQARIDAALASGEIFMLYQPKVHVQTGEIVGVEALVRWRDPVKGLIPPDHFIRQCETAGRMAHLTRHVLTQACRAGVTFQQQGKPIKVAVNISSTLVHEPLIVSMVSEVLKDTGFPARNLVLEITETYRISHFERAAEVLGDLRALGPSISMDDFGVGAASLEALQRLPFDELKIDRTFISAMSDQPKALAIVRSVLQLGQELRITVVAEGVENAQTLDALRENGCLVAQGFGISRPISSEEVLRFQRVDPNERLRSMV